MKDKWMNNNYENDELKPFVEPLPDFSDQRRIEVLLTQMAFSREEIEESLRLRKYDDVMANYLLLGRRTTEVCILHFVDNLNYLLILCMSNCRMKLAIPDRAQVYR